MSDTWGGGLMNLGGGQEAGSNADAPTFGSALRSILPGPNYRAPDPAASALDQTSDTLQQRIQRANSIATNPIFEFFSPEGTAAARDFVPKATEQLQKIRAQKADMQAGRVQAQTLGLAPGEVPDEASQDDRIAVAQAKALKGDLRSFTGLAAVHPQAAAAIQDQVHETVAGHLTKAQLAFDSLSAMQNQGQYEAKLNALRKDGTLTDLEALGLKVPGNFDVFNASKGAEAKALREARIGVETLRAKLEARAGGEPMEKKEQDTYAGRLTTESGHPLNNVTWSRINGKRVALANGMADMRDFGDKFNFASPEQRKAFAENVAAAVPKEDIEKYRAFNRTYELATTDAKGNKVADRSINTNPNVQQGIAEGLASMLRGGSGGANVGLLKIELAKRGWAQSAIDGFVSNYAGAMNTMFANADKPYLSQRTREQIRDVMDVLKTYNDNSIGSRVSNIAREAGELGLKSSALGLAKGEAPGVEDAIEAGRQSTINRFGPRQRATSGGDGGIYLDDPPPVLVTQQDGQHPVPPPVPAPVQRSNPALPTPEATGSGGAPSAPIQPAPAATQPLDGPAGGGRPSPITIAGQPVSVSLPAGASPNFVPALQRIETGKEKDPWTAGTSNSSASGAFQFTNGTWGDNKPAGAPARAKDATPAQQAEALTNLTAKNAAALTNAGLPVNDTSLYVTHNLGQGAGPKLLTADPNADARTVVGERAAANNPLFFRGKPTVATVLARYDTQVNQAPKEAGPGSSLFGRLNQMLMSGAPGSGPHGGVTEAEARQKAADVGNTAVEHAPAIASTLGAAAGSLAGPAGMIAGGAAGGGAGQALKDYMQGRTQSPTEIAKQTALGGVFGVASEARPVLATAARVLGAGGVEAGAEAIKGGEGADIVDAGLKGAGLAAGGEAFGRALGMIGHKVWNLFAPDAKKAVQTAAAKFSEAEETLAKESPKLPSVGGMAGGPNPKYEAAEKARTEAETVLKDAGLKPDEAAYAHKVSTEGVPKQEAEAARPGAVEQERVGKGYQQLEQEVGAALGAPRPAAPKLTDGPRAAVENKQVSAKHAELAEHVEAAITAPAQNWQDKWIQLKDARSALLTAERDALTSTAPGRTRTAADMRTLADTVRTQQAKVAKHVFGEKDGEAFMARLKVLDTRYRNLMEATNGGDLAKAAAMTGEAGREAERKFIAFAHDDPQAISAYRAMRGAKGNSAEATVPWTVAAEGLPVVGKAVKVVKLAGILREWARERTAGNPVKFSDLVKLDPELAATNQGVRNLAGTAAQRGAVMQ